MAEAIDAPPAAARTAVVQLPCAIAAWMSGAAFGLEAGIAALTVFALAWPPRAPWRPLAAKRVLAAYLPFAVAWLMFVALYLRVTHACGWTVPPQPDLARLAHDGLATPGLVSRLVGIVVIAPVLEEVLFRGYLFTALDVVAPRPVVHVATAVAFGAVHGAGYALPIGVLALFFGWLRARHGSLLPSILAHAGHNALTVGVTMAWPGHLELLYPR